jgi:hypothetical protein
VFALQRVNFWKAKNRVTRPVLIQGDDVVLQGWGYAELCDVEAEGRKLYDEVSVLIDSVPSFGLSLVKRTFSNLQLPHLKS